MDERACSHSLCWVMPNCFAERPLQPWPLQVKNHSLTLKEVYDLQDRTVLSSPVEGSSESQLLQAPGFRGHPPGRLDCFLLFRACSLWMVSVPYSTQAKKQFAWCFLRLLSVEDRPCGPAYLRGGLSLKAFQMWKAGPMLIVDRALWETNPSPAPPSQKADGATPHLHPLPPYTAPMLRLPYALVPVLSYPGRVISDSCCWGSIILEIGVWWGSKSKMVNTRYPALA